MNQTNLTLSKDELNVLIDALQFIDIKQEGFIESKTGVSLPSLYNKLYSSFEQVK